MPANTITVPVGLTELSEVGILMIGSEAKTAIRGTRCPFSAAWRRWAGVIAHIRARRSGSTLRLATAGMA